MKIQICGNTQYKRERVLWLAGQLRELAPKVLGEDARIRISVSSEYGRHMEEWAAAEAFDLVRNGVVHLQLQEWNFRGGRHRMLFFALHELFHAKQMMEGRLCRGEEDWTKVYFRPRGQSNTRRHDLVRAYWITHGEKSGYVALRYRRRDGKQNQGPRLPWEREAFRDHRRTFPKNYRQMYDNWVPR